MRILCYCFFLITTIPALSQSFERVYHTFHDCTYWRISFFKDSTYMASSIGHAGITDNIGTYTIRKDTIIMSNGLYARHDSVLLRINDTTIRELRSSPASVAGTYTLVHPYRMQNNGMRFYDSIARYRREHDSLQLYQRKKSR